MTIFIFSLNLNTYSKNFASLNLFEIGSPHREKEPEHDLLERVSGILEKDDTQVQCMGLGGRGPLLQLGSSLTWCVSYQSSTFFPDLGFLMAY